MPATQKRISPEVNDTSDLPQKGRSELSKDEMRAAQFTPDSEGPGIDRRHPDSQGPRSDAAPNEQVPDESEENARVSRASV